MSKFIRLAKLKHPYYRIRSVVDINKKRRVRNMKGKNKTIPENKVWVSATKVRNYLLNNFITDVIQYKNSEKLIRGTNYKKGSAFDSYIAKKGDEFEDDVVKYISGLCLTRSISNKYSEEGVVKTIKAMKQGIPVIHSAPINNSDNNTFGIIDLLVRSDYLHKIVDDCPLDEKTAETYSPLLNQNYFYLIIDVKWSRLHLTCNGTNIINSKSAPAWKGQTLIYNDAIGKIQGYTHRYAYIMGNGWKYKKNDVNYSSDDFNSKLGVIDFHDVDEKYVDKTREAIDWVNTVAENSSDWGVDPPSFSELYPNMKVTSYQYNNDKKKVADNVNEITKIWYCGIKRRDKAFAQNVFTYENPRCTAELMGFSGHRAKVINSIIKINRKDCDDIITPSELQTEEWREERDDEFFVDFEGLNRVVLDEGRLEYMIGVYHKDKGYKCFNINILSKKDEFNMIKKFHKYVHSDSKSPKLWHWGHYERSTWNRLISEYDELTDSKGDFIRDMDINEWTDMNKLFINEGIAIKGCFNYGLKSVANSMYNNGLINEIWDSDCINGMDSMLIAKKCYDDKDLTGKEYTDIKKYNMWDTKMLYNIITYLRENH